LRLRYIAVWDSLERMAEQRDCAACVERTCPERSRRNTCPPVLSRCKQAGKSARSTQTYRQTVALKSCWKNFCDGVTSREKGGGTLRGRFSVSCVLDFDAKNAVLRATVEGVVTDKSLLECYAIVAKYFASHPPCRGMLVFSHAKFEVSSEVVKRLASGASAFPGGFRRVFVTPTDVVYGMARMFQILAEKTRPDLHVVRTLEEAYKLLQIESPEFEPVSPV
jgi:hypothetical protein